MKNILSAIKIICCFILLLIMLPFMLIYTVILTVLTKEIGDDAKCSPY